jgi:hypothetical protein
MGNNEYIYVNLVELMKVIDKLKKQGLNPEMLKITLWHGVWRVEILENGEEIGEMDRKFVEQDWQ